MFTFRADGLTKEDLIALEEFKASDERIAKIVKECKKFTRDEFKKNIKPADVIIPYKRARYTKTSLLVRVVTQLNKWIQGSSFTSCKIVGKEAKEIIGYGVVAGKGNINHASIDRFFNMHEGILVLRHTSITDDKREKILDYMYDSEDKQIEYDKAALVKSLFKHAIGQKNSKTESKSFSKSDQKMLICSSLVLKCYKYAGLNVQHDSKFSDKWIWPKDFILSKSFKVVGGYFAKEAKVPK